MTITIKLGLTSHLRTRWASELAANEHKDHVIVGAEPTGHYWFTLAVYLRNKCRKVAEKKCRYMAMLLAKIDKFKSEITKLDSSISTLKDSEKQKELENLLETIKKSGKSPEEVIAALKNNA